MARDRNEAPLLPQLVKLINGNVGKVISVDKLLLGYDPHKKYSIRDYVYQLRNLGYIEMVDQEGIGTFDKEAVYMVKKAFPEHYNSSMLRDEMRIRRGLIPESRDFFNHLNRKR